MTILDRRLTSFGWITFLTTSFVGGVLRFGMLLFLETFSLVFILYWSRLLEIESRLAVWTYGELSLTIFGGGRESRILLGT